MAKVLIKNGPPEFDMIHAYFRQGGMTNHGIGGAEVEMTFGEEGKGIMHVYYVRLDVMIPWTATTKTWKFRAIVWAKEDRGTANARPKAFIGIYSFQTRTGEGVFVDHLGPLKDINLGDSEI